MLFLSICSYAQNGTGKIKGVVMDDSGDEALTGATLLTETRCQWDAGCDSDHVADLANCQKQSCIKEE